MTNGAQISDEDLTAYLDGEADDALTSRIEQLLESDLSLAEKLKMLEVPVDDFSSAFDALLPKHETMPPLSAPGYRPSRNLQMAAMAACVAAALGIGFMFGNATKPEPGWTDYVAAYQALYVNETLASIDIPKHERLANAENVSEVIGRDLTPATAASELDFKRAQILGYAGKPLIQMAYLDSNGAPFALCVVRNDAPQADIKLTELEGLQSATWSDGGYSFLLIGGSDADFVARHARDFQQRL